MSSTKSSPAAPKPTDGEPGRIRVGVSACLLGQNVRWDGGHKRDRFLTDVLARWIEFVPVCPEVGIGLPTPRPTLRLVGSPKAPRIVNPRTDEDYTEDMAAFARSELEKLASDDLCGFVLKKDSPSCGLQRVRVYGKGGVPNRDGRGLFAEALTDRFPELPIEEEGRLNDPVLRESFLERLFALRRWKDFLLQPFRRAGLSEFHRVHKYSMLAHSPDHYSRLGRLAAGGKDVDPDEQRLAYGRLFLEGMAERSTIGKNHNVLQHLAGYFKRDLDAADKRELGELFGAYRRRMVPLVVPLTLVRHHVRRLDVAYLADQVYLEPTPSELMLRNHV